MTTRVFRAYLFEMYKAIHYPYTLFGPALVLLVVLSAPLLHPMSKDGVSDYGFIAYVTPVALNFLGFLLLLIYCAGLVSSELGSGTIRQVLVRPVRRHEFLIAKLLSGMTYAVLLTGVAAVSSWTVAWILGDLVGVNFGGELLYTREQMSNAYLMGTALSLLPQWAGVSYAILLSTLTRSPVAAASTAAGLWIAVDLVKYPLGIEPFLFSTYLEKPWTVFASRCNAIDTPWFPMVWYCAGSSLAVFVVCAAAAMLVLHRRNLSA